MIVVIADDLSGAAEVAGIARRYGYRVTLRRDQAAAGLPPCDVVVYDTDTRDKPASQAVNRVAGLVKKWLSGHRRPILFKKIDSACRGHIVAETEAILQAACLDGAILVPASPVTNRFIINGRLFIGDRPVNRTPFRHDPGWPMKNAHVGRTFQAQTSRKVLFGRQAGKGTLPTALILPDARSVEDLRREARRAGQSGLPAGSAAYFEAYLQFLLNRAKPLAPGAGDDRSARRRLKRPVLFVDGSTNAASKTQMEALGRAGVPVGNFRVEGNRNSDQVQAFCRAWKKAKAGAVRIRNPQGESYAPWMVGRVLARTVRNILFCREAGTLVISGGETAGRIARLLKVNSFVVAREYQQGVVRLRTPRCDLVIKPGSYGAADLLVQLLKEYHET